MKITFAVGKCDRKTRQLVVLQSVPSPIIGPFTLKAITQSTTH